MGKVKGRCVIIASGKLTRAETIPISSILFLPSLDQGDGVGSSLLISYLQTMNPLAPF